MTRRSSRRSRTISPAGCSTVSCGSVTPASTPVRTAPICNEAPATTSSPSASAADRDKPRPHWHRAGRYHSVVGNLEVKEVRLGEGARSQRLVICHNPEVAARDRRVRENLVCYLGTKIEGSDDWTTQRRDELVGELRQTPAPYRLLRRTKGEGLLRIDKDQVANEERFDGKFLLRTSDDTLSSSEIALAYKQLYEVERGWRDLRGSLELRPVFHYREDRIRAHVQLCWLALLLIRTIEHTTGDTWRNMRHELERMHLVTLETKEGRVAQRSMTTPRQRNIFAALEIAEPARFFDFELPAEPVA